MSSAFFTYCWVSVEPPCVAPPAAFEAKARTRPLGSTPPCSKKRRSSTAITAFCMWGEISSIGTMMRFSV